MFRCVVTHQNVAMISLTLKHLYFKKGFEVPCYNNPSIAQLVERRTVKERMQISLGHWFKSGSREIFFVSLYFEYLQSALKTFLGNSHVWIYVFVRF